MKISQTVEIHENLLKVINTLLSKVGFNRADLNGKMTFAGLDSFGTQLKLSEVVVMPGKKFTN